MYIRISSIQANTPESRRRSLERTTASSRTGTHTHTHTQLGNVRDASEGLSSSSEYHEQINHLQELPVIQIPAKYHVRIGITMHVMRPH